MSVVVRIDKEIGGFWVRLRVRGYTNLVICGFGWMIVVFDGWIGFGMKSIVVLVYKFCDLVKFGESYGGLKV